MKKTGTSTGTTPKATSKTATKPKTTKAHVHVSKKQAQLPTSPTLINIVHYSLVILVWISAAIAGICMFIPAIFCKAIADYEAYLIRISKPVKTRKNSSRPKVAAQAHKTNKKKSSLTPTAAPLVADPAQKNGIDPFESTGA